MTKSEFVNWSDAAPCNYIHACDRRGIWRSCLKSALYCCFFVAMSICATSCSKSDDDSESLVEPPVENPQEPVTPADYSALKSFVRESVSAADYCRSFSAASGEFRLVSNSGKSVKIDKGAVPYILLSASGDITVDGKTMRGDAAPAISRDVAPSVSVGTSGNLLVEGKDLGVKAGKDLRCVINARKHIYFCFAEGTMTLPSEVFVPYNPALPVNASRLNILFIGNSFTVDATEHLPAMLTASGINNVSMTRLYHGGYTLPEYNANFSSAVCARYEYTAGAKSWSGNATIDDKPSDALAARDWDVIVIQEHTGRREGWDWPGTLGLDIAVEGLRDLFFESQPSRRPTVVYLLSQTYSTDSYVLSTYFGNNRETMFARTTSAVKALMADTGIDVVISTAAVLENLRTSRVNNALELTRDTYHMDFGLSRYAAACAVFETIVTPATGKKIDDCPYRYSVSSTEKDKYTTPVTDDNAPVAQRAAREAVKHPFAVTAIN